MLGGVKIILKGSVPPKKNSRQVFVRHGRVINIPSPRFKAWEQSSLWALKGQKSLRRAAVSLEATFYVIDNRQRDLDNMLASVMDVLVKADILASDSWQTVNPIKVSCAGIDKLNPRVEICIKAPKAITNISGVLAKSPPRQINTPKLMF